MTEEFRNILVIKLKHLGDVLTSVPVVHAAKKIWPAARISFLVNPGAEDLVRWHPQVTEVFSVPRNHHHYGDQSRVGRTRFLTALSGLRFGLAAQVGLIRELRSRRFDLAIELSGGDRGAFLAWASGARIRIGYGRAGGWTPDRRLLFTKLVDTVAETRHTVEYHLDTLRALGGDPGPERMALHWPVEAQSRVQSLLTAAGLSPGTAYAAVHPTSRWMFKAWRPEANALVIDHLIEKLALPVVVTAAPDPEEMAFAREVLARVRSNPVDLTGRLSLPELAALIAGARLFFGVDSLPMHMAAAVNTPAVVLFGPSGEHMWGPWGAGHRVIAKDWACRPCGRDGCDGSKVSRCLMETTPEEVYPALAQVLGARRCV